MYSGALKVSTIELYTKRVSNANLKPLAVLAKIFIIRHSKNIYVAAWNYKSLIAKAFE